MYVDRTCDGKPYYVGKGMEGRVRKLQRNGLHGRISHKYGQVRTVEFETSDESAAFSKERELIAQLKTRNTQGGANFTDGGEGVSGYTPTDEMKASYGEDSRRGWAEATPEQRAARIAKQAESMKAAWQRRKAEGRDKPGKYKKKCVPRNEQQKLATGESSRQTWANMSPEARAARVQKMAESRRAARARKVS